MITTILALIWKLIQKLIFKTFGEVVIDAILNNPETRKNVFFYLAEFAVEWTETDFDDNLLAEIKKANKMGDVGYQEMVKAVGKKNVEKLAKAKSKRT